MRKCIIHTPHGSLLEYFIVLFNPFEAQKIQFPFIVISWKMVVYTFFKISPFYAAQKNKSHTGLKQHEGE